MTSIPWRAQHNTVTAGTREAALVESERRNPSTTGPVARTRDERVLGLLILYKWCHAALALATAGVLAIIELAHHGDVVLDAARWLRAHATGSLVIGFASWLAREGTPQHVRVAAIALALDGCLALAEGIALSRRWRWGSHFVVVTVGLPIPFELASVLRHWKVSRVLALVFNSAVLVFLIHRARHEPAHR
jgi:uncharacterized membrane protein (DUF2068 family)